MTRPLFHRVRRNGAFKILGEVGSRGLGILYVALLARWVGDESFGRYSFALSFSMLFAVLLDFGSNSLLVRDLARHREELASIVTRSSALRLIGAATTWSVIFVAHLLLSSDQPGAELVPLLAVLIVVTGVLEYHAAIFAGLERMGLEAALRIQNRALCLTGAWLGHTTWGGLVPIVLGMLFGFAVSLAIGAGLLRHARVPLALRWDRAWKRRTLHASLPLLVSLSLWKLYENQGLVVLGLLGAPLQEVGWYAAAIRLIDMLRAVPALLSGSVFPVLAESTTTDPNAFQRVARFALQTAFLLALPLAVGTILLSDGIITTVFSAAYEPAGRLLAVAIGAVLGIFLNGILTNLLIASDHQRQTTPGAALVAVVNLALLVVLVPRFGGLGAAWALVASESAYLALNVALVQRHLRVWDRRFLAYAWRPVLATAVMAGGLTWLLADRNVFLAASLGALLYAAALLLFRGLPDRR